VQQGEIQLFTVHNLTTKTVILSDLKAEIGPRKIIDLERIAHRDIIERSRDLKQAINTNRLRLVKYSVVKTRQEAKPVKVLPRTIVEKTIERDTLDEERLRNLIRDTVANEIKQDNREDISEIVKQAVGSSVKDIQNVIRNQLNNIHVASPGKQQLDEVNIEPDKLANLQQKYIESISGEIETSRSSKIKKVKITNSNVRDLADQLLKG